MKNLFYLIFSIFLILSNNSFAQINEAVNPKLLEQQWEAKWITHPDALNENRGVYLFKKEIMLSGQPEKYAINVSADNRYKLYINGKLVTMGPARGDLMKWRFETIDISKDLQEGKNVISAIVWDFGNVKPVAQMSFGTRFIVQSNSSENNEVNTNKTWKTLKVDSYTFHRVDHINAFYASGPIEEFNANSFPWDWKEPGFQNNSWIDAEELDNGQTSSSMRQYGSIPNRFLFPRDIPFMESKVQYFKKVRRASGISDANNLIVKHNGITFPSNSKISILLDQEELTNAYLRLHYNHGKDSRIKITYAESLYHPNGGVNNKGNRDAIEGKEIKGNYDVLICDGDENRVFEPLWWKSFRYVQLDIETKDEPLEITKFYSVFTAYPLVEKASFSSSDATLANIWNVGWRTQRLCAGETFFDCPYYEQLQYTGDTRIQSLITYYVSGDTLLWRKAIADYYDSRYPMGITQSRYPSSDAQFIPTFSLIWITMLNDYLMYCNDSQFIKSMMPAVIDILQWFEERIGENGLPGNIEYWTFVDWVNQDGWNSGVPPLSEGKSSSVIGLQYIYTINIAVELLQKYGYESSSKHYEEVASTMKGVIKQSCWDSNRNLFSDTPDKKHFSQHANVLAVLADVADKEEQKDLISRIYNDNSLAQCSYYFTFYLIEAMRKVDSKELYFELLPKWKEMLDKGLTTFAEQPDPTRSDCHAWSASPLYFFLSMVCGIEPSEEGFNTISISPEFGDLDWIEGSMPHKLGEIKVNLKKNKGKLSGEVVLPRGLHGVLNWSGKTISIEEGANKIEL